MKIGGTLKVFLLARMNLLVVFTLISLGFVSQGFAVLRPPFPAKPVPPYNGEVIIIGDDLAPGSKRTPGNMGINGQPNEAATSPSINEHPIQGELLLAHAQSRAIPLRRLKLAPVSMVGDFCCALQHVLTADSS